MFVGTHYHKKDDKNRVSVPKPFRSDLEHGAVITRGLDGCLFIFTADSWSILADKLSTLPLTSKVARDFLRLLTHSATPVEMDKLGRTRIPENLAKLAGIKSDVVFAGSLTRVEIWSKSRYHDYFENLENQEGEIESAFQELGI